MPPTPDGTVPHAQRVARRFGTAETITASRALLAIVARSMSEALEQVTLPQFRVLVVLSGSDPVRMGALAAEMGALPSTFSRVIDRMVEGGWVERVPSPESRREVLIRPTAAGQQLVRRVTERRRDEIGRVLATLSEADQLAVGEAFALFADASGEPPRQDLLALGL